MPYGLCSAGTSGRIQRIRRFIRIGQASRIGTGAVAGRRCSGGSDRLDITRIGVGSP